MLPVVATQGSPSAVDHTKATLLCTPNLTLPLLRLLPVPHTYVTSCVISRSSHPYHVTHVMSACYHDTLVRVIHSRTLYKHDADLMTESYLVRI